MTSSEEDIASALPKGTVLLSDLATAATNVCHILKNLTQKIKEGNLSTEKGLSLLELKNQTFLSYLSNLSYTTLLKLTGLPLKGSLCIDRLVELRLVLERVRPLEDKLKHQIQNYHKVASTDGAEVGPSSANRLEDIEASDGSEAEAEEDEGAARQEEQPRYKAPRVSRVHYPGEGEQEGGSGNPREKRERARALASSMLRDALAEHTEDPEEVLHGSDTHRHAAVRKRREIERYEEDNFTRLTLSKKEKASLEKMSTPGVFGKDLLSFRSLEGFEGHEDAAAARGSKRKKGSKVNKKKGFKKRKKH